MRPLQKLMFVFSFAAGCAASSSPANPDAFVGSDAGLWPETDAGVDAAEPEDAGLDAAPLDDAGSVGDPDSGTLTGAPVYFVISSIDLPVPENRIAVGFDLDGKASDGTGGTACDDLVVDFSSPSGGGGIDNQLSQLAQVVILATMRPVGELITEAIVSGQLLIVFELSGVDDWTNDDTVQTRVLLGACPMGTMGTCPLVMGAGDAGASLSPGQSFELLAVGPAVASSIQGGQLLATTDALTLSFDFGPGAMLELTLREARIGGSISPGGITDGMIGGALRTEDLVNTFAGMDPAIADLIRMFVQPLADLEPDATGMVCGAVSAGLAFTAIDHGDMPVIR